nr:retrovirus-related Pol polyprotein from transposon TNT 1-94 [Tanacetum cinerariifolium]
MNNQPPSPSVEKGIYTPWSLVGQMGLMVGLGLVSLGLEPTSAKVKTVNEDVRLQALVDGKKVIFNEASIRRNLRLDDAEGTACLPNATIIEELTSMGYEKPSQKLTFYKDFFSPQWKFLIHTILRKQRKETKVPHIKPQTKESIPTPSNDPLPSGEDKMQLTELMNLCTILQKQVLDLDKAKIAQAKEIADLKKRVKKLKRKKKSRTSSLKRLYNIGLSSRIISSDEEGLGDQEDASKQERITEIDADENLSLIDETAQDQGRMNEEDLFKVHDLDGDEVIVDITAGENVERDATVAKKETLIEIKASKPRVRGVIVQEPSEFRTISSSQPSHLPNAKDKGKGIMVEIEKPLKKKEKIMMDEEVARKLKAEMKAKMEEEEMIAREKEEANRDIVPKDDDDVAIEATPLYSKSPTIVGYKIYKEGKKSYLKIIREDGNSQNYLTFGKMFKNFNREDLEVLRSIVKERFKKTKLVNDMDNLLFQTLRTIFEHQTKTLIKKLEDSYGEHQVLGGIIGIKGLHRVITSQVLLSSTKLMLPSLRVTTVEELLLLEGFTLLEMRSRTYQRRDKDCLKNKNTSKDNQNRRNLPRDIPLDSVVVLRYEKRSKSKNKGKVPTEMEPVLEQTQQEHQSNTKVFTMTMEILLEPTPNKLLVGRPSRIRRKCNSSMFNAQHELCFLEFVVGNKMHKAFPLPVIEFPLAEEVLTASEEGCHCQKKREAIARKIALLSKSRRNCQSKSNDSFTKDSYEVPASTTSTTTTDTKSGKTGKKSGRTVTLTAEDMQKKKNVVKARTTLLLSLPDEHQLLQVIIGQLQFMDVEIQQDDLNQKFLTSLAQELLMHTIVWRNRSDLDTMSLDDLYNHLKVYESKVQKKSKPNSQNMAFISSAKHSNGNEDDNTACVPTASTNVPTASASVATISQDNACTYIASQSSGSQIKFEDINQINEDDMEEIDIKWNMALLSMRDDKFWKKTGKKISIQGSDMAGFDKLKVECFNYHKMCYFDWSYMANDKKDHALVADEVAPTKFALMANTSAESKVFDNSLCSKDCKKNNDSLNSKITDLTDKLFDYKNMIYHYKLGLAQVESRLVEYKEREVKYCEKIRTLEFRTESNNECIEILKKKLETLKQVKEGVDGKLAGLLTASKDLDNLIESETKTPKRPPVKYAEQYRKPNKKPNKRVKKSFTPKPVAHRRYRPPNFPTANRKFPTASRKFPAGSTKCSTADMGKKGNVVKPLACWLWKPSQNLSNKGPNNNSVSFRIQQYLQHEHYALWEVIEFRDSYEVPASTASATITDTTSGETGKKSGRTVTLTVEDMQKKKNVVKERTTLLLSLSDEHQLRFTEGSETLEQTFNRLQVIVGQLQFMDVEIEQDDLNQKFLTSLAPEWHMHTIIWRNKSDLDTMSLDDLYNHLKVYESEVQKNLEPNSQNMAFISSAKHSSRNEDGNSASVSTASTNVSTACANIRINEDDMEKIDIKWSMALLSMRADKFWKKTGKKIAFKDQTWLGLINQRLNASTVIRWVTLQGSAGLPEAKIEEGETTTDKEDHALVADEEAPTEFALMANTSTKSKVFDNSLCSKDYKKNNDSLNKIRDSKEEKEGVDGKLTGFLTASKDLDNLIESQRADKNKDGLGYSAVSPPPAQIYSSPKKDLSWTALLEFANDIVTNYSRPSPTMESTSAGDQNRNPSVSKTKASPSVITPKPFIKFVKASDSPTESKINKAEKAKKSPVKNFPTVNRKFPTASRKFPIGSTNCSSADMGIRGKAGSSQNKIDDKGYWDSGCSRHMTCNISYLSDYEPFDGGYMSFGQGGCKITGKGTIKTDKLECDNGEEFRNKEMNDFCSQKGIKREFSNARTPQQNGVAERRNRTLIEAARTMLADAKLPVTFWAEAFNTACYVQNRVLVNKSYNKTPYQLYNGRSPAIGFLKPFGCHIMILNTLDNLRKFKEKGDEGYFIGYSMSSKAFRVFNKRTRRVEENLHVEFLENKAIEKGAGLNWLFDIDSLTKSMNYVPVDTGTISTNLSGIKDATNQEVNKDVSFLRYIALPNWAHDALLEYSSSKP